jgi:integrase
MKYSTHILCACRGPDGKSLGQKCPDLWRRDGSWNSRHGSAGWAARIPTSAGTKLVKRYGYPSKKAAETAAGHAGKLLGLGTDDTTRARIGDLIAAAKRGAPLPSVEDVARRLGLGLDPGQPGATFGQAWADWLAGNKRLRASARRRLDGIGRHWLLPVLADVPLERLSGAHCSAVFDRIDRINAGIASQRAAGKTIIQVDGDVRARHQEVGVASQHRIFAALRTVLNFEVKVTHRLTFNPVYAVQLEPEETPEAGRWSRDEAARFLAACADDPLGLLFRVAVLRGARRAELCGFRWASSDLDAGYLAVDKTILQLGGKITPEDKAKTRASKRRVWLDDETARLLHEHRRAQLAARMKAGPAWEDSDLVFCRDDGSPWPPDYVSRRFKEIAAAAGVPVIPMKDGTRHTGTSLARDAGVDPEIRQETGGWTNRGMMRHYTHVEAQVHRAAANQVAGYVEGETGS